ncbi:hypothetical protein, conserved [Eimeria maxima]|uniref:Uncharacterized protein n=1 Tax=Eimeria maxima TaxID=5804 RepID=U6MBF1_EIMMA|nr:hypothetical protein, conserved [Eimeria maxima]CDJ60383.1 hypothetical protein, conserved [Eimeria maxima]
MQRPKCDPEMIQVSKGNILTQPQAAAVDWFLQLLPSGLLHPLRSHESPPDASGFTGGSAKGTDPNPEVVNDHSARECKRGDSLYVECVSAFWKVLFEPPLNSNSPEQRVASFWFPGSWCSWVGALQHGPDDSNYTRDKKEAIMARGDTLAMQVTSENLCPANEFLEKGKPAARRGQPKGKTRDIQSNKEQGQTLQGPSAPLWQQLGKQQRRHQELLIKERQKQQRPEELSFGPAASWAFLTNFCQFIFGSCFGHQTLLHHEGLQGPEQSQENEDTAALESCKGTMWSDTNLQLVCGTRCRSLRRVKDEGRQVWMEYQEVTLLDNSRRFQWVELTENGTGATE